MVTRKRSARPRGRHHEILRQWDIIRTLEVSVHGKTLLHLAQAAGVTQRTIRRDLEVLELAGVPLVQHRVNGETRWRLNREIFKPLAERGFTLSELIALYFSRALIESLAGTPFHRDLQSAFDKIEETLPRSLWRYLERLPAVLISKREPRKLRGEQYQAIVSRLTQAALDHRRVALTYHSFSSRRVNRYRVEPYKLAYGQGGLYLHAFVPGYGEMRTFAVERIKSVSVLEEGFTPADTPREPFANSLGVYTGAPESVLLEFAPEMAPYILEREWHGSQKTKRLPDGSVQLALTVSVDWALRNWVLSFGGSVRVLEPKQLAQAVFEEIEEARSQYAPRLDFEQ